jgi:hypothetical protein
LREVDGVGDILAAMSFDEHPPPTIDVGTHLFVTGIANHRLAPLRFRATCLIVLPRLFEKLVGDGYDFSWFVEALGADGSVICTSARVAMSRATAPPPDHDGDGVPDATDVCPNQPGPAATNGCPDNDGDGIPNINDNCPTVPNPGQADGDQDGIGDACDADNDNDGVPDANDNCPTIANAGQVDSDQDGMGDACDGDDDNDGVPDGSDACPLQPGPAATSGCPDSDNDGIADSSDACPTVAGVAAWNGCPALAAAPTPLSPADGSVFSIFPRTTTLTWSAVAGATSYVLEIEFCQPPDISTCPSTGSPYTPVTLTGTSYTFDFVGAQPGRWRVQAVNAGGSTGFSAWTHFIYTV